MTYAANLAIADAGRIAKADAERICRDEAISLHGLMLAFVDAVRSSARVPVSGFQVGAVARGVSGDLYLGTNLEIAGRSLSSTVHAEQSAVVGARAHGDTTLTTIVVSAQPCGSCRQFLSEFTAVDGLRVVVSSLRPTAPEPTTLDALLPRVFPPDTLVPASERKETGRSFALVESSDDSVVQAALEQTGRSYAPYTRDWSGVALELEDDTIIAAPYIESVAFNPSMSPMLGALSRLVVSGHRFDAIRRAVLVEVDESECRQRAFATHVLSALSAIPLEYRVACVE